MTVPLRLVVFFVALIIWFTLLVLGFKRRSFGPFVVFGIVFLVLMNVRYLVEGAPAAIAFFIGIYDVLDNLGLRAGQGAAALATCPNNTCSVWGNTYLTHPSWGTAFHARFLSDAELRTYLLYAHLSFNSIVFVLMHVQLWRPGGAVGSNASSHKTIGRISFACLTVGTLCALWLASSHGSVSEYGGNLSMVGFWSMSLFVLGPLLRDYEAANILVCIWLSGPLGILIAEVVRRKLLDKRPDYRSISSGAKLANANP